MPDSPRFRCGCLRRTEWRGFWKATLEDPQMTDGEWDKAYNSLTEWLSKRYLVKYTIGMDRHCWVEGDYAEYERTLKIVIMVPEVLTLQFLNFIQEWLRLEARLWRVAVPTDNTDDNLILVYPEAIKVNSEAENDLAGFIKDVRPLLSQTIESGRVYFGLKKKPYPPLPE